VTVFGRIAKAGSWVLACNKNLGGERDHRPVWDDQDNLRKGTPASKKGRPKKKEVVPFTLKKNYWKHGMKRKKHRS